MGKRATSTRRKPKRATGPQGGDTPPTEIPIPSLSREERLPIHAVGSVKFEELCRDVLQRAHPEVTRRTLKRTSGQRQFGVDVEGFNADHESEVLVSCKCYRTVEPYELVPWTQAFVDHLGDHWKGKGVKVFILAVTHPGNSDELIDAIRKCRDLLKPHGIRFELWDTLEITDLLRKDVALVDRYFNRVWVETISPQDLGADDLTRDTNPTNSGQSAAIVAMAQEIAVLASERDSLIGQRIEAANAEYRSGRSGRLLACLDELQGDHSRWSSLDPSVRARVLRARAMFALNKNEVQIAGELITEADTIAKAPDRYIRAWYLRAIEGSDRAIEFLAPPHTAQELEVLASLHIENGNAAAAIALMDEAAEPSPELLRVRALAQCLTGDRETAVRTAAEASSGPTPALVAVQTHAILHVMAALAPGADVQLGAVPSPISTGLVRVSSDAIEHLNQAIDILGRQIPIVDEHLATELELWKLAALLLHPNRTRESRQFANELLNRANIDPLAAAWCHSAGMRLRYGQIRKNFEDAIRAGEGTATHVVTLAILEAERSGDTSAAALIEKHRPGFQNDDDFLYDWQKRFQGVPDHDAFAVAMHRAESGDSNSLSEFVLRLPSTANQILAAASFFAITKQWHPINAFREKLLSLATPRAIELAARAAFESGSSADTIAIIEASTECFQHGRLPEGLLYLRARAHDTKGNKGAALADMRAAASTSRDPKLVTQLIHSLISIGKLREARQYAKSYVKLPAVKTHELLQFANVFKNVDANFSRNLVKRAAEDPELPHHVVGGVLTLASSLGLADIEGRMMRLIGEITKEGSAAGIFRYDTIEDALAFIKQRGEALEEEYELWRKGMKPGHLVFDAKTFSLLHLAAPRDRLDAINNPLPMLTRAANAEIRAVSDAGAQGKPDLIVDISALLVAMRYDILAVVEKAYKIQIPESLPLALLSIEDDWPTYSDEFIKSATAWLSNSSTAVRITSILPEGVLSVGVDGHPPELDFRVVATACRRAITSGELSPAVASPFLRPNAIGTAEIEVGALALEPWSLVRLAQAAILEPIARTIPTYISTTARNELATYVSTAERHNAMHQRITALREHVAKRLSSSVWTTLPHVGTSRAGNKTTAAPHLRSLLEVLDAVKAGSGTKIWIEDRPMSRTDLSDLVNIIDIAHDLFERGFIDVIRADAIDLALRTTGYAFMPIPIERLAADVEQAMIVNGVVVESPELAEWRCWFAQEVERLAFANQALEQDDTGRIVGEPRHLLNMISAARDVLGILWANTETTSADKIARSNWVWTCLRFETSPSLSWSTIDDRAKLSLMATVLVHTADLALVSSMTSDVLPEELCQPYMDWFIGTVLDPRCDVDPLLGQAFARQLAGLLAPQLEQNLQKDRAELQNYMKLVISKFLEYFPDQWRERIVSYHDLDDKIGAAAVMALEIGDISIPADEVELALAEAADGVAVDRPGNVTRTLQNGLEFSLNLRKDAAGELSALIEIGEQEVHLDGFMVALTLPDPIARLSALQAIPASLDLPPDLKEMTLRDVAALPSLAERVIRQKALFDREFARRLDRIRAQLEHVRSVDLLDLAPPVPEAITQYLRSDSSAHSNTSSWLREMTEALTRDHGIEEAARRICGIPFNLPDAFIEQLASIDLKIEQISSAAHARLLLKACIEYGGTTERREQLVGLFLDRVEAQSKIMAALLWKGVRQIRRLEAWKNLNQEISYALLWVWADRLTASICLTKADASRASDIIRESETPDLTHVFASSDWGRGRHLLEIDEVGVRAALVASVLPDMEAFPEELRARLLATIGTETQNGWYPRLALGFPVTNEPLTWTTTDAVTAVLASGAVSVASPFDERIPDLYVHALIAEPVSHDDPFVVPGILARSDLSALSHATVEAVRTYLEVLVGDKSDADRALSWSTQRLLCSCHGVLNDTIALDAAVNDTASAFRAKHGHQKSGYVFDPSQSPLHRDLAHLIEMILAATRYAPGEPKERVAAMAKAIESVPNVWPGARQGLIAFLDRTTDMLEAELVSVIWPSLLRLRSLP